MSDSDRKEHERERELEQPLRLMLPREDDGGEARHPPYRNANEYDDDAPDRPYRNSNEYEDEEKNVARDRRDSRSSSSSDSSVKDAAEVAASDPLSPHAPAGTGLERESGLDTTREGLAQMEHENPANLGEAIAGLVGLAEPKQPDQWRRGATDGNTAHVPLQFLHRIAKRFMPVVYLSADEQYRPCTLDWYFDRASLYYDPEGHCQLERYIRVSDTVRAEDLNPERLFEMLDAYRAESNDPRLERLTMDNMVRRRWHMMLRNKEDEAGVPWSEINRVPFYTRIRRYPSHWEILYAFVYAYNGPYNICGRWVHAHSADVEHITVRTNADATRLEWCYFGAHGMADGMWRQADEIELEASPDMAWNTRPVVYAADHGHGTYPRWGTWYRLCGFANDRASPPAPDGHNRWDPVVPPVLLFDARDPRWKDHAQQQRWQTYSGTLGEDGTDPIHNQAWWHEENAYQNNCFRRCLWPCRYLSWRGDNDFCYNCCQSKVDFNATRRSHSSAAPPPPRENMG